MTQHSIRWLALAGIVVGTLILRLVALLFAARPDNVIVRVLLTITAPLVLPFRALDRLADQPQWGARLELATVAAVGAVLVVMLGSVWLARRRQRLAMEESDA